MLSFSVVIFYDSAKEIHPYSLYRKKVIAVFKLTEAIDVRTLDLFSRKKHENLSLTGQAV